MPHATPSNRKIGSGDVITIDMGCSYNGYCSDMTRTIFVDYINENIKNVYNLVLDNQEIALNEVKDGASIKIISRITEGNLKVNGYDLMHALGHGIGMNVHEDPIISYKNDRNLKQNMVIAIEPGVYIPSKFGVRIEDTVLVCKERKRSFNKVY